MSLRGAQHQCHCEERNTNVIASPQGVAISFGLAEW